MADLLKMTAAVALLLGFFGLGVAHIIKPDWFIRRSGVRRGGELLTDWNRMEFQLVGAIFAGLAAYVLYHLFRR